jgi:hypothetical protein
VILVPKFLESIALSILAFIHNNYLLHCIYLFIVCFVLGNPILEPLINFAPIIFMSIPKYVEIA